MRDGPCATAAPGVHGKRPPMPPRSQAPGRYVSPACRPWCRPGLQALTRWAPRRSRCRSSGSGADGERGLSADMLLREPRARPADHRNHQARVHVNSKLIVRLYRTDLQPAPRSPAGPARQARLGGHAIIYVVSGGGRIVDALGRLPLACLWCRVRARGSPEAGLASA